VLEWSSGRVGCFVMKVKSFRDLLVWQRGMAIARAVYQATEGMPKAEMFALTSQMRRAACSVPMNITEGYGRRSRQEFIRSLRISVGSLLELMTAYEIATSLGHIQASESLIEMLNEEERMLASLIRKLEAKQR
jgi:four helix bundle protein